MKKAQNKLPRVYLDYAATTPTDPAVRAAMLPYFSQVFGNPGSLHRFGQEAIAALDASRQAVAELLGVEFRDIIFTGGATEANNIALRGAVLAWRRSHPGLQPRLVVSSVEHDSLLQCARQLEREGAELIVLPVSTSGVVDVKNLEQSLNDRTVLVSVLYVNNEIGTVQPLARIANVISQFRRPTGSMYPLFHTDAAQAFHLFDCSPNIVGVDMMTLSSHKMYGPKGVGVLYRNSAGASFVESILSGGGQEFGLRPGTENVAGIVGFASAARRASDKRLHTSAHLRQMKQTLWTGIQKLFPRAKVNGPTLTQGAPSILNVWFPGRDAHDVIVSLDLQGVAVSAGSACLSRSVEPSHVLQALGYPEKRVRQSIRFSFGLPTTRQDITSTLTALKRVFPTTPRGR